MGNGESDGGCWQTTNCKTIAPKYSACMRYLSTIPGTSISSKQTTLLSPTYTGPLALPARAYLITDNLAKVHLPTSVDDLLELPASHVAHPHIADLPRADQVVEGTEGLFNGCPVIPAMSLMREKRESGNKSEQQAMLPLDNGATVSHTH